MTNERIVYTRPDGGVSVVVPTGEVSIEELKVKVIPADATNVREITTAELPQDRVFRGAWDDSNPEEFVGVNLGKAKDISHEKRRAVRAEKFAPLDVQATIPAQAAAAEAARQVIRDEDAALQSDIDACVDVEGLKGILQTAGVV